MRIADGLGEIPRGFAATCRPEDVSLPVRFLGSIPVIRRRVKRRLREGGVIYLVPHPDTTRETPDPIGWVVRWEEQLHYD